MPILHIMVPQTASLELSKSQDEEISIIGAVLYGSLFIYHEDLLLNIVASHYWVEANKDKPKPIIIDLVVKPFRRSSKLVEMIFFRAERS
jgi:hypothetical protein